MNAIDCEERGERGVENMGHVVEDTRFVCIVR